MMAIGRVAFKKRYRGRLLTWGLTQDPYVFFLLMKIMIDKNEVLNKLHKF